MQGESFFLDAMPPQHHPLPLLSIDLTYHSSPGADSGMEGFPLRHWSMRVVLLHADTKQDVEADIFETVTYKLHESFGPKATQGTCSPRPPRYLYAVLSRLT